MDVLDNLTEVQVTVQRDVWLICCAKLLASLRTQTLPFSNMYLQRITVFYVYVKNPIRLLGFLSFKWHFSYKFPLYAQKRYASLSFWVKKDKRAFHWTVTYVKEKITHFFLFLCEPRHVCSCSHYRIMPVTKEMHTTYVKQSYSRLHKLLSGQNKFLENMSENRNILMTVAPDSSHQCLFFSSNFIYHHR